MIKIMFVCHGNICRSPMAEFIMKDLVNKRGLSNKFTILSSATSYEEIGNPVHYGTKKILNRINIDCSDKRAVKLMPSDYNKFDYFIGMDEFNIKNMLRLFNGDKENKVKKLLEFSNLNRSVADPWYTGDFETTYNDVLTGCNDFLEYLIKNEKILSE